MISIFSVIASLIPGILVARYPLVLLDRSLPQLATDQMAGSVMVRSGMSTWLMNWACHGQQIQLGVGITLPMVALVSTTLVVYQRDC